MKAFDWFLVVVGIISGWRFLSSFAVDENRLKLAAIQNPVAVASFRNAQRLSAIVCLVSVGIFLYRGSL